MSETGASSRNFADFYLPDNVYRLAGGLIPEIAERLDVKLGNEPNKDDLQAIMDKVGRNRVLRHNEEITAIDRDTRADMIERGGTQTAFNRSLWTPEIAANKGNVDVVFEVTCVGNWQDRAAEVVAPVRLDDGTELPHELSGKPLYSLAGMRVMDTVTELVNPNVIRMRKDLDRYPTEAEYARSVINPKLRAYGFDVRPYKFPTQVGDEILKRLFEVNPELLDQRIAVVRNANAGVISAIQMRTQARKFNPAFDTDPKRPQALVLTDSSEVARTDEQEADSRNFQKTDPGIRQLVLAAMKQHEAAGGE